MGSIPVAVVAGQPMSGSPGTYMFDIAVISGMKQSVLIASVTDGSRASTDYEARKCQHLSTLEACTSEGLQFVPLVVDACGGGWGLSLWKPGAPWVRRFRTGEGSSVESQCFLQTLGIALQRENARAVLRRLDWWVYYPLFLLFWPRLSQTILTPWFYFHLCFSYQQLERADWLAPSATLPDACGYFIFFWSAHVGPLAFWLLGHVCPCSGSSVFGASMYMLGPCSQFCWEYFLYYIFLCCIGNVQCSFVLHVVMPSIPILGLFHFKGDVFTRNFGDYFVVLILDNFGKLISGIFLEIILETTFGVVESCSGAASRTNFGEQISGRILGSSFVNNFLE